MKAVETKYTPFPVTLEEPNILIGYAARFNQESQMIYDKAVCSKPFFEILVPGCFSRSLRENPDVRALFNHDSACVLGRTTAKTLVLTEDDEGLHFVNELPDTSFARDLRASMTRGDIDGCSFQGFVSDDEIDMTSPGEPAIRYVKEIRLVEVTPATAFPAYLTATAEIRSQYPEFFEPAPVVDHSMLIARARLALLSIDY